MQKNKHDIIRSALTAATFVCAVGATCPAWAGDWNFNIGPAYRGGMNAKVSGPSKAALTGTLAAKPVKGSVPELGGDAVIAPEVDTVNGFSFDDGSIGADMGGAAEVTGGAYADGEYSFNKMVTGTGVEAGSSVSRSVSTDSPAMAYDDDDMDGVGLRAEFGLDTGEMMGMDTGISIGFRGFWGMDATLKGEGYNQTVTETTKSWSGSAPSTVFTYTFVAAGGSDTGWIENGAYTVAGGDTETGESVLTGSKTTTWTADSKVSMDVDASLYQMALDMSFGAALSDGLYVGIRPALLFNIAEVDIDRSEVFSSAKGVVAVWNDSGSSSKFAMGLGVEACLQVAINDTWDFVGTAGYEYIDKVDVDVGPSNVEVDFSGYTISLMLGKVF